MIMTLSSYLLNKGRSHSGRCPKSAELLLIKVQQMSHVTRVCRLLTHPVARTHARTHRVGTGLSGGRERLWLTDTGPAVHCCCVWFTTSAESRLTNKNGTTIKTIREKIATTPRCGEDITNSSKHLLNIQIQSQYFPDESDINTTTLFCRGANTHVHIV